MLDFFGDNIPFDKKMLKYYFVTQCCFDQQLSIVLIAKPLGRPKTVP